MDLGACRVPQLLEGVVLDIMGDLFEIYPYLEVGKGQGKYLHSAETAAICSFYQCFPGWVLTWHFIGFSLPSKTLVVVEQHLEPVEE